MNTSTLTYPRPLPLALPEPIESRLQRMGVAPWMITGARTEFWNAVEAQGGEMAAFEQMHDVFYLGTSHKERWDLLWEHRVRVVERYSDGRVYQDTLKAGYQVGCEHYEHLAERIAHDTLVKLRVARDTLRRKRKGKRELEAAP